MSLLQLIPYVRYCSDDLHVIMLQICKCFGSVFTTWTIAFSRSITWVFNCWFCFIALDAANLSDAEAATRLSCFVISIEPANSWDISILVCRSPIVCSYLWHLSRVSCNLDDWKNIKVSDYHVISPNKLMHYTQCTV